MNTTQKIEELLNRGVAEVIDRDHLKKRLEAGETLRVKLGIDPTSPHLHLGRAVTLLKLRDFQELGHQIVFIVGDFTGIIGDTSDKDSERPMLTRETIQENLKTYTEQAAKLLDMTKVEVRYNSEWLEKLDFRAIGELANIFSLSEFIARENIRKRLDAGKRVSLRELLYPLMQGYDSIAVKADVEIGGTDQRFNLLAGRELQPKHGQKAQDILMTNLILGTDGRKMSSSWGNTINLTDTPQDMFGKVMSIPDELIIPYFIHCTRVPMETVHTLETDVKAGANPRDAKVRLATALVALYHGDEAAKKAEQYFQETFSEGHVPESMPSVQAEEDMAFTELLVKAKVAGSKSEARRKIEQGGVEVNGVKLVSFQESVGRDHDGAVVKVGKKDFFRIAF